METWWHKIVLLRPRGHLCGTQVPHCMRIACSPCMALSSKTLFCLQYRALSSSCNRNGFQNYCKTSQCSLCRVLGSSPASLPPPQQNKIKQNKAKLHQNLNYVYYFGTFSPKCFSVLKICYLLFRNRIFILFVHCWSHKVGHDSVFLEHARSWVQLPLQHTDRTSPISLSPFLVAI